MRETRGTFKNCVILLDEPGMYLYPQGQRDLLARLKACGRNNTLIHTTCLLFLLDLEQPRRMHFIENAGEETTVSNGYSVGKHGPDLTSEAVLLSDLSATFCDSENTLVLESIEEVWILQELSLALVRTGKRGSFEGCICPPRVVRYKLLKLPPC